MKALFFTLILFHLSSHASEPLQFPLGSVLARTSWTQGPVVGGESILKIEWLDMKTGQPAPAPGAFVVEPYMNMPGHGHGASENTLLAQPETGVFLVKDIYFSMPCEWEIRVHVTYPNGQIETRHFVENVEPARCPGGHGSHRH